MPPEERFGALLDALERDLATLRRYAVEVSWDAFVRSEDTQNMVLFGLYRASQTAIDLGQRLLAGRRLGPADTYTGVFDRLGQHSVIEVELATRLRRWAGLRNVLAHIYRLVDLETIYATQAHDLGDLESYLEALRALPEAGER